MADAVSLSSQNSLRPIRTLGKKAQTSIEPEGSVSSDLSASYYIEVGKDLGYAEVSGMKATTNFENLTPRTIEVAGVTGSFYLKSYKLTIVSNAAVKADVTYVSFEPLSGQITKKPNDLVYATGFSGLAHYWTSEIYSDVGTVNVPIFNFAYSFSANLTPIYTLGRKYPKQVLLIASEEEVNILKDQYKPVALEEQVVAIYAGVKGYLDKVPVKEVTKFEKEFIRKLSSSNPEILESIKKENKITDEIEVKLKKAIEDFVSNFINHAPANDLDHGGLSDRLENKNNKIKN